MGDLLLPRCLVFFLPSMAASNLLQLPWKTRVHGKRNKIHRIITHTPLEVLSGSGQCTRLMAFTQLFFGISGIQNRREQNFLPSTFSVIAILRYPTFPYCFYYIAILQLSHFREIFTILLASSDRMYLESYNFLRFYLTSMGISW